MKTLYEEILSLLSSGQPVVRAVVIQHTGSAPRTRGASMLIRHDGSFIGSIGGGRLEAEILVKAREVFSTRESAAVSFQLTGREVADSDMICGGNVEVFVDFLNPAEPGLTEVFSTIIDVITSKGTAVMATVVDPRSADHPRHAVVTTDRNIVGGWSPPAAMGSEIEAAFQQRMARLASGDGSRVYTEPVFSEPVLYIFGAGHISQHLARMAAMVHFQVVVIDDRKEFANRDRFPLADQIVVRRFEGITEDMTFDEDSYIVIVTRGHLHDYTVLRAVLGTPVRYIGMIGSRRKRDIIYRQLQEEGAAREQLDAVHAPIGLDINADTPEEIAVSITAELIKVRGTGGPVGEKGWKV